jgi:DNA-binding Lrp family transcriptional regulator
MTDETDDEPEYQLDDVDRGVLFALQRDARNVTAQEMADEVGVSPSTVRNRIANLENVGVIEGYQPVIDYEKAGFQLRVLFVATVSPDERHRRAKEALQIPGVIDVREMLTSKRNLYVEAIATSTRDLAAITGELSDRNLDILSSEIVTAHYSQPFGEFEF